MCNLFRQRSTENLGRLFDAVPLDLPFEGKPAIYPRYEALVVRKEGGVRRLEGMAWGIVRTLPGKTASRSRRPSPTSATSSPPSGGRPSPLRRSAACAAPLVRHPGLDPGSAFFSPTPQGRWIPDRVRDDESAQSFAVTLWDRAFAGFQKAQAALDLALDDRTLEFFGASAAMKAIKSDARRLASPANSDSH